MSRSASPKVSVVIPTLNEELNIADVLSMLDSAYEVILVDKSTDLTVQAAIAVRPNIKVIHQTSSGKGAALKLGFAAATGDIIIMMDADGSTQPGEISKFIKTLIKGADFAKGSRYLSKGGSSDFTFFRWLGNTFFTILVRVLFGTNFTDLCYGYNAFWSDIKQNFIFAGNYGDGFEIETLISIQAIKSKFRIQEVPSFEALRKHGKSHLKAIPDGLRVLKVIFKEYITYHQSSQKKIA